MYNSNSPAPEPQWQASRATQSENDEYMPRRSYSPAPTYLPAPVPPATSFAESIGAVRTWIRIPVERPIWTQIILAVLVGIFVLTSILGQSFNVMPTELNDVLTEWGAKVNSAVVDGQWWRLITAMFLHNGLLHIASNGYALYVIGMDLEGFFGRARFLAIYFIAGFAGSVASFAFSPYYSSGVGASGAIFGLIGALAVYFGMYRRLFGKRGNLQFWNIIVVVILNLGLGFSGILPIDNSAHMGGLVAGALVGYVLSPRYALGEWETYNVRSLVNINKGRLPWMAAGLLTLITIALFFVVLLLFTHGYVKPNYIG